MVQCNFYGCRETAAVRCGRTEKMCGKHCHPRCSVEDAHGRRGSQRGVQGSYRRQAWRRAWHRANALAERFIQHICVQHGFLAATVADACYRRRIAAWFVREVFEEDRAFRAMGPEVEPPPPTEEQQRQADMVALVAPRDRAAFATYLLPSLGSDDASILYEDVDDEDDDVAAAYGASDDLGEAGNDEWCVDSCFVAVELPDWSDTSVPIFYLRSSIEPAHFP